MTRDRYIAPPAQTPTPRLAFRPAEVAQMLGIPRSTLYDMIRRGDLRSVRVGSAPRGILLVPAEELTRLLRAPMTLRIPDTRFPFGRP